MTKAKQLAKLLRRAMPSYIFVSVVYTILWFTLPANQATMEMYNLSLGEYRIVSLIVLVPTLLVWLAAFIGQAKLRHYARSLRKTDEGEHFIQLARGGLWLAWSLPIPVISTLILNALGNHWPSFHPTAIIVSNYINLVLPLVAFTYISGASRGLVSDARVRFSLGAARVIMFGFLAAGVLYCFLVFRRFDLTSLASTNNPYFLPIWLTVLTVTIPYLYVWFMGVLASYEITLFSRNARGVLYRQAMRYLVSGLVAVIVSSIMLQYINGVQPRAGHLIINFQLVTVVFFHLLSGAGFALLALGAIRLKKIEEV